MKKLWAATLVCAVLIARDGSAVETVRADIAAAEGARERFTFSATPENIRVDRQVMWGSRPNDGVATFSGQTFAMVTVTTVVDTSATGQSAAAALATLESMAKPVDALRRPSMVVFTYGKDLRFGGVMVNLSVRYTKFLDAGTPVRAEVTFALRAATGAQYVAPP